MRSRFSLKNIVSNIKSRIQERITNKTVVDGKVLPTNLLRKREKIVKKIQKQYTKELRRDMKRPFFSGGEKVTTVGERRLTRRYGARESGVVRNKLPKSIQSEEDLKQNIERLSGRLTPEYQKWKIDIYRKNFLVSAKEVFGNDIENFQQIVDYINSIDDNTLAVALKQYEELDIDFIYTLEEYEKKLNEILNTLESVANKSFNPSDIQYNSKLEIM